MWRLPKFCYLHWIALLSRHVLAVLEVFALVTVFLLVMVALAESLIIMVLFASLAVDGPGFERDRDPVIGLAVDRFLVRVRLFLIFVVLLILLLILCAVSLSVVGRHGNLTIILILTGLKHTVSHILVMDELAVSTGTLTPSILVGIPILKLSTVDNRNTAFEHVRSVALAREVLIPAIVLIADAELIFLLLTLETVVDSLPDTVEAVSITEAFASLIP